MEYQIVILRDGSEVSRNTFNLESNVTDPSGRYTLSVADVKVKRDTFARAVEFAAQSHANMEWTAAHVAGQSETAKANREAKKQAKLAQATAQPAQPATVATAESATAESATVSSAPKKGKKQQPQPQPVAPAQPVATETAAQ